MAQEIKDMVEKIPAEMRWTIATRALAGMYVGLEGALQDAVGPESVGDHDATLGSS